MKNISQEEYDVMSISEFVTLYRPYYKNYTEFAEAIGVTQSTISKYKNGQLQPNKATAYTIFKKFGVVIAPYSKEGLINYGFTILLERNENVKTNER